MKRLGLALAGIGVVSGAYVQTRDCAGGYTERGMRAALGSLHDEQRQLKLSVADTPIAGSDDCKAFLEKRGMARLEIMTLGSTDSYEPIVSNYSCVNDRWGYFDFEYAVAEPRWLDSLILSVELRNAEGEVESCVNAPLTPEVPHQFLAATTWIPVIILTLAIIVALWREMANLSVDQSERLGPSIREASRFHVTRVADCIAYIQFIFLSSALSLRYPGFLQPVTSRASWSTLMFPTGLVQQKHWYTGAEDGIYVTNGTMSGSAGLELMTQIAGGTTSFDNWLNIVSLAALIFVILVIVAYLGTRLAWVRDWFQATHSLIFRRESDRQDHMDVLWTAVRLFCAYLLLPLVTWTTYQLVYVRSIPVHYCVIASVVICILILLLWWTVQRFTPREAGYLLVDNFKEHRDLSSLSRTQDYYSMGIYALLLLRGVVHGGLQLFGTTQLLILVGLEVVQLSLQALAYKAAPISSRSAAMPPVRLAILALQGAFIPDAAGHGVKMVIGYIILVIHALVLLGLFLIPAMVDFGLLTKVAASRMLNGYPRVFEDQQPPIYGLRRLDRRPSNPSDEATSRRPSPEFGTSLSFSHQQPTHSGNPSAALEADRQLSFPYYRAQMSPSYSPSLRLDTGQQSFFRPPRCSSTELLARASELNSQRTSDSSTRLQESPSSACHDSLPSIESPREFSGSADFEKDNNTGNPHAASVIDPEVDYSVREVDQYYIAPRRLSFNQPPVEDKGKRKVLSRFLPF